jgi:FdhD protein
MQKPPVAHISIKKVNEADIIESNDILAAEEPLEIRLVWGPADNRQTRNISVTMRTPGSDAELAAGFLYTEGIIKTTNDIAGIQHLRSDENITAIELKEGIEPEIGKLERNFYTTSSCGVCGKSSIDAVITTCPILETPDTIKVHTDLIYSLTDKLRSKQDVFENTGGIHASALFDLDGNLLLMREDVGRHNALDKLIGAALQADMIPLDKHILLLSGRASFELIQKASMAGIKIVAAVGAPSSLAAQLADDMGMTLIGFLRGHRFNIYSGAQRIII